MDDMKTRIDRQDRMAEMHAAIKVGPPPPSIAAQPATDSSCSRQCVILRKTGHTRSASRTQVADNAMGYLREESNQLPRYAMTTPVNQRNHRAEMLTHSILVM